MPELQLLGIFLIFCSILFLAYIVSRFVGKKLSASAKSKYMHVVEQISLGLDKHLLLVRVGSQHYLFLSGRKEFKMVAQVDISDNETEEPHQEDEANGSVFDFRQIFDKYFHKDAQKRMKTKKSTEPSNEQETLKKNIHRLKQLREKSYDKEV